MPFARVEGLTELQAQVLMLIIRHVEEHGFQPSMTELAETLGVTVKSVRDRLLQVAQKGYLEFPGKKQERCYRLKGVRFTATVEDREPEPPRPGTVPSRNGERADEVVAGALAEFFHATDNEPATVADMAAGTGVPAPQLYEFMSTDQQGRGQFERVGKEGKAAKWRMAVAGDDK